MSTFTSTSRLGMADGLGTDIQSFYDYLKIKFTPAWDNLLHGAATGRFRLYPLLSKRRGRMGGQKKVSAFVDKWPQSAGLFRSGAAKLPNPVSRK